MPLQISMVLYAEEPVLSAEVLGEEMVSKWPGLAPLSEVEERDGTLAFRVGEANVIIGLMPAPIPWSDLEGPCATSLLWPNAANDVRGHTRHAIVTVRGESAPVALSTLLTQVTAALMLSSPAALGAYWGNAALVMQKNLFVDFAVEVLPHELPLSIWINTRAGWTDDDQTLSAGFTTGLAALGHMELEARDATEPPSELRRRLEAIARYLLENGPVFNDGDTLGANAHEKIRVSHMASTFGVKGTVMRLIYAVPPSPPAKKSWWKRW
jgi:hypothetical protein